MHAATIPPSPATIRIIPSAGAPRAGAISPQGHCSGCPLRHRCLPSGLPDLEVQRLDALLFARRRIRAGQALFREGDRFAFVHAVRSGTFKSTVIARDGREQVTGFHLPGDVLGLDSLATAHHASTVTALEDGEICAIPYASLSELAAGSRALQQVLSRVLSAEIVREHNLLMLLGTMGAEERVAAFILDLSQRMRARGYSSREFHLRMSRAEMGSYLGLTLETVSRCFTTLQQRGLLEVRRKHVRIPDLRLLSSTFEAALQ